MKMRKIVNRLLILLVVALFGMLLFSSVVSALGVGPAKTIVDYIGPEVRQESFYIFREDTQPIDVVFEVEGLLSTVITLPQESVRLSGDITAIPFTLNIPDNLPPGPVESRIVVTEKPSGSEGSIGLTSIKLPHKVIVNVPYPDKFVNAMIRVEDDDDKVELVSVIENVGSESINSASASFDIFEKDRLITTVVTTSAPIAPFEHGSLSAIIDRADLSNGVYETLATIRFDDKEMEMHKAFEVGKPRLLLSNYKKFYAHDSVNEFVFEVTNDWNGLIEDVYAEISISSVSTGTVAELKTFTFDLAPHARQTVTTHWDARGLSKGEYTGTITFFVGSKSQKVPIEIEITDEEKVAELNTMQRNAVIDALTIVAMGLFALVLIGALFIMYNVMRKKKE